MTDAPPTTGLHHVTNICTDMEETGEFYEDVLGWHTVKRTRNYDDPGTLHNYVSSAPEGEPGATVTYFSDSDGLVFELATAGPGFGVGEEPGGEEIDPFEGGER